MKTVTIIIFEFCVRRYSLLPLSITFRSSFRERKLTMMAKLLLLALLAPYTHALLRFSCSQLVVERLDPLVNPGADQSPHVHQSTWLRLHRLLLEHLLIEP